MRGVVVLNRMTDAGWIADTILATEPRLAPIGSIVLRAVVRLVGSELRAVMPEALTAFGEAIN